MECPLCKNELREGAVTIFESLGGKLTRKGVLPIFPGESWRKLRFRESGTEDNDKYIHVPLSRSGESANGQYCLNCGSIIIKGKI
ncbi:hypothetical protein ACFL6O_05285 [candidate division KSB1 bacterium]